MQAAGGARRSADRVVGLRDGKVDYDALTKLVEWQIASGIDAIVAVGTTASAAEPVAPGQAKDHVRAEMKVQLTIQEKYTLSLSVLAFALVGVPLGIRVSRRETSANLGVAVGLALGYYVLTVMVGWLDRHPEYHPDILLWLPNLIFLSLGVWLFRRIEK